ncbi:MAG: ribonuclease J [Myxococcales bacterium]|nr:ribonuclease J [Myxococcales bacterium]
MSKPRVLEFLPLGGVGRIGMNAMLMAYGDDAVLLDCGVMFPEADQLGVDVIVPSLAVLKRWAPKLRAFMITHGHEDHIGALPWALRTVNAPVYATRFTSGLIQHKLREHGLADSTDLRLIAPGKPVTVGPFEFNFLRVTHSIPDCVSLAIRTPVGNVVFTGDFKIESGLRDGCEFDAAGFQAFGKEGVLLMMSDSTNAEVAGWSGSEDKVGAALAEVIAKCAGRVIVTLFASNVYRLHSVVDAAREAGRYVALAGRSLRTYIDTANGFTNMPFAADDFIELKDIARYDDNEIVVVCTGSQAEPRAALARAAQGGHPDLTIKATDTVVLSSRVIPGNERRIHQMLNNLARRGAHVVYSRNDRRIHASGHAAADEQKQLLQWVNPRWFVPVHGEYTFLQRHADLAREVGVQHTLVVENGTRLEVTPDGVRQAELLDVEPWYVDQQLVGDADTLELPQRAQIGWNGVVAVTLRIRRHKVHVSGTSMVKPFGVPHGPGTAADDLRRALDVWIAGLEPKLPDSAIEGQAMQFVRRHIKRVTSRKPVVLAFVHDVGAEPVAATAE